MAGEKVTIGNVEITSLSDGMLQLDACNFFPDVPAEAWETSGDQLTEDRRLPINLASFLVRSDGRTILVDTGMGPPPADAPDTPWGSLLDSFQANNLRPEDVDMVVMTHLHRDHVGWNLQRRNGGFSPTFPNARYYLSAKEWEACHSPELQPQRYAHAPDIVWPLEEMGLMELVEGEHALTSELTTLPTPGHTPGHMSIVVTSQGQRGLILGDVLHSLVQVDRTDWVSGADIDPVQTRITRRSVMQRLEMEGSLVAAGHLPAPGFGRVVRVEGRRYWQAV